MASSRKFLVALFTAVFVNAVGFRALTASVVWPGLRGAPAAIAAAAKTAPAGQAVPARKLRRRRHHAGQVALPQQGATPAASGGEAGKPFEDGDSADSRAPSSLDHPPA